MGDTYEPSLIVIIEGDLDELPAGELIEADLEYPDRVGYKADKAEAIPWGLKIIQPNGVMVLHEDHIDNAYWRKRTDEEKNE